MKRKTPAASTPARSSAAREPESTMTGTSASVRVGAQFAQQLQPAPRGDLQVQQDQVGPAILRLLQGRHAVRRFPQVTGQHVTEKFTQQGALIHVILYHKQNWSRRR